MNDAYRNITIKASREKILLFGQRVQAAGKPEDRAPLGGAISTRGLRRMKERFAVLGNKFGEAGPRPYMYVVSFFLIEGLFSACFSASVIMLHTFNAIRWLFNITSKSKE